MHNAVSQCHKIDIPHSYYHVYARGASRQNIFNDDDDYAYFQSLPERYLSIEKKYDSSGRAYAHLYGQLELLAYCLMPNHFHLLFFQDSEGAISTAMRGIMTSYSRYFNTKYDRSYIHLNHKDWRTWPWSSYLMYKHASSPEWVTTDKVLGLFTDRSDYLDFVADYEDNQRMRDLIKHELASE